MNHLNMTLTPHGEIIQSAMDRLIRLYAGEPYKTVYGCEPTSLGYQQRDERLVLDAVLQSPPDATDARVKELEAERDTHAKDWADTDIAFRKLCESVMSKEVIYGDSYGVPGILDLAVLLVGKAEEVAALKAEVERLRREVGEDETPITEDWLRSVGFKPKQYQGEDAALSLKIPSGAIGDNQWIELCDVTNGVFLLCRWADSYDEGMPPDRVCVEASTRGQLVRLFAALGIPLKPAASEGGEG